MSTATAPPRRRAAVRTSTRADVRRQKLTIVLDEPDARRLAVHAAALGLERSSVVADLIRTHLRRFRIQDLESAARGDSAGAVDPPVDGGSVEVAA